VACEHISSGGGWQSRPRASAQLSAANVDRFCDSSGPTGFAVLLLPSGQRDAPASATRLREQAVGQTGLGQCRAAARRRLALAPRLSRSLVSADLFLLVATSRAATRRGPGGAGDAGIRIDGTYQGESAATAPPPPAGSGSGEARLAQEIPPASAGRAVSGSPSDSCR